MLSYWSGVATLTGIYLIASLAFRFLSVSQAFFLWDTQDLWQSEHMERLFPLSFSICRFFPPA